MKTIARCLFEYSFYGQVRLVHVTGMQIATCESMGHMFQFAVLACFTLLYGFIALVLVVRVCAPLIRNGSVALTTGRKEGDDDELRNISAGKSAT